MSGTPDMSDTPNISSTPNVPFHLAYLDGLRALAALFVVLHHIFERVIYLRPPVRGLLGLVLSPLNYGHYAVDLFIVLSGFCLMLPVLRHDGTLKGGWRHFLAKRARRILPPYYCATGVSLVLIALVLHHHSGTPWDQSIPVTAKDLLTHLLLVHDTLDDTSLKINGVLWSIAVEWRIYFLFPLLLIGFRRWGTRLTTMSTIVVSYAVLVGLTLLATRFQVHLNVSPWGICPHFVGLFTVGMLGARTAFFPHPCRGRVSSRKWPIATALMAVVVVFVTKAKLWQGHPIPMVYADFFVGLWAGSLLVSCAHGGSGDAQPLTRWLVQVLSWRPLTWVGSFAYSIYLIHEPLLQLLWQFLVRPLQLGVEQSFFLMCLLSVPCVLGGSYSFFVVCERPFLNSSATRFRPSMPD